MSIRIELSTEERARHQQEKQLVSILVGQLRFNDLQSAAIDPLAYADKLCVLGQRYATPYVRFMVEQLLIEMFTEPNNPYDIYNDYRKSTYA